MDGKRLIRKKDKNGDNWGGWVNAVERSAERDVSAAACADLGADFAKAIQPDPSEYPIADVPTMEMESVRHVGTFNPDEMKAETYEGRAGISVTTPDGAEAWRYIARLGADPEWTIRNPSRPLQFVDAHSVEDWTEVEQHCIDAGYVTETEVWEVSYWDDELEDTCTFVVESEEEAECEASEIDDAQIAATIGYQPTPKLSEVVGGARNDELASADHMLVAFALDRTEADGVFWDDNLDGYALSAPRGTLFDRAADQIEMFQ